MPQDRRSDRPAASSDSELLSLAAHEFRTPASVVGGYLRMLLKDTEYPLSERQRKMIDEADKACMRMVAIVAELSEIAKLDANTAAIARTSFDLFPALDETASQASEARDRGVQLQVSGESEGAQTAGDRPLLQQAFAAIFRAVLREQPDGSRVVVDRRRVVRGPDTSAVIVVARADEVDSARSSAPAPFNEYRGGMGLALPIARRVVERHRGRIWSPPGTAAGPIIVSLQLGDL